MICAARQSIQNFSFLTMSSEVRSSEQPKHVKCSQFLFEVASSRGDGCCVALDSFDAGDRGLVGVFSATIGIPSEPSF